MLETELVREDVEEIGEDTETHSVPFSWTVVTDMIPDAEPTE